VRGGGGGRGIGQGGTPSGRRSEGCSQLLLKHSHGKRGPWSMSPWGFSNGLWRKPGTVKSKNTAGQGGGLRGTRWGGGGWSSGWLCPEEVQKDKVSRGTPTSFPNKRDRWEGSLKPRRGAINLGRSFYTWNFAITRWFMITGGKLGGGGWKKGD